MIAHLASRLGARATLGVSWAAFAGALFAADHLTPLGERPDWPALAQYHETITQDDFERLLRNVYCTRGVDERFLQVGAESVRVLMDRDEQTWFTMRFATKTEAARTRTPNWRSAASLPPATPGQELAGLKIALDPGHLGGGWAEMEERWFQVGDSRPVQEGDMTLLVAQILAPKLEKLGAKVSLVRAKAEPVTAARPQDLKEIARQVLLRAGEADPRDDFAGSADPGKEHTLRWQRELLFYRNSEIRARAKLVNDELKPDLVLCLHFNAEPWDNPLHPTLVDRNHFHLLINGSYLPAELEFDDVRFEMIRRLLSRTHEEESPLAEKLAGAMAGRTQLPPYEYTTDNVTRLDRYVYLRNLLATRLFEAPVLYFEPYVMNSEDVFWRVQEGDYEGLRSVNGIDRPSIFREYAAGIVDGLVEYYRAARRPNAGSPKPPRYQRE